MAVPQLFGVVLIAVVLLLTTRTMAAAMAATPTRKTRFLPLSGTFIDVSYDDRLRYVNNVSLSLTCEGWAKKVKNWKNIGIDTLIFQSVHDSKFGGAQGGCYYRSDLSFMQPYLPSLKCYDVVKAVLSAADAVGSHVLLTPSYPYSADAPVTNATGIARRIEVMHELAEKKYTAHRSFAGWYFSAESYLQSDSNPTFPAQLISEYLPPLTAVARELAPLSPSSLQLMISPFGTHRARHAQNQSGFLRQLKQLQGLGITVIAYQDEVGCIRDQFPMEYALGGMAQLGQLHEAAGLDMWINIESFTWENRPNNISSPLISATAERVIQQIVGASMIPAATKLLTFTMQGDFESPTADDPWGRAPDNFWLYSEYSAYATSGLLLGANTVAGHSSAPSTRSASNIAALLALSATGSVVSQFPPSSFSIYLPDDSDSPFSAPAAPYNTASLIDGICGPPTTASSKWLGIGIVKNQHNSGSGDFSFNISVAFSSPFDVDELSSIAVRLLSVPENWFRDGSGLPANTVQHETRSALPSRVLFTLHSANVSRTETVTALPQPDYYQLKYDLRSVVFPFFASQQKNWRRQSRGANQRTMLASVDVQLFFSTNDLNNTEFVFVDEVLVNPVM